MVVFTSFESDPYWVTSLDGCTSSIQGNIKGERKLVEPCQIAMENDVRRALIPMGSAGARVGSFSAF